MRAVVMLALALVACGAPAPRVTPPPPAPAPARAPAMPAGAVTSVPPSPYLPRSRASGSPYCFDPDSPTLRAFLERKPFAETDRLDTAALADDVRDLHGAMEKLYAGFPELLQDPQFDVDRFFADWEARVRGAGNTISFADGILAPLVEIKHHIRDNHLAVWGWDLSERSDLAFAEYQVAGGVDGFDAARCTFEGATPVGSTARVAKVLTAHGLEELTTFSARSVAPSVDVRCGDRTTTFTRRASAAKFNAKDVPVYEWHTVGNASAVVVRHLHGSPADEALLARIAEDYAQHVKKPLVVFDFRGNGGGNDGYVARWIDLAKRGRWTEPYAELRVIGAARACGDWNRLVAGQIRYGRIGTPEAKAERDAFVASTPLGSMATQPVQVLGPTSEVSSAKAPYGGRVIAVVDRTSDSSGESAPDELRAALGATIVGERSGGFLEFGDVRPYTMPRTGVTWALGSKRNYYATPRDGVGLPVDVYLDPALLEAPIDQLVPLLATLPRAAKP